MRQGVDTIWIGIDDTDSPRGGCTTWVLTELLVLAREEGVDLLGEPRLVRLNPNIPWKTRGNAALAARFGRGTGHRRRIGEADGRPLWSHERGGPLPVATERSFVEKAWARVLAGSRRGEPRTDPALVAVRHRLPARLYYRAVREIVPVEETRRYLESVGAEVRAEGDGRGLVGASAAIAWPGRRVTWELLAYRPPVREGARRRIDGESVRRTARRHPGLFLCHDPRTRRLLVAPHTPCPILFGLRGRAPASPMAALREVRSEPVERWVLFRTNQATGDHLVPRLARELVPYASGRVTGRLMEAPRVLRGGHVKIRLLDIEGEELEAIAFEPTKTLPRLLQQLTAGDRVEVWGSRGTSPVLKIEGVRLLALAPRWSTLSPPVCPNCGRTTRSLGAVRGYRCPSCRRRLPPEAARRVRRPAPVALGEYHPTPSARRHLAPLGPEP
ncbi:MAG TPA: tRNA(Ile)(2)-agmatinylcytidine synthase [Thermoplasmata archaeon]|nr:tRNA(Ile)(2)-agmatinylcytidine synthase [Thermoplasmata archaeon]